MLLTFVVMCLVTMLDQATKAIVVARLPEGAFTSRTIFGTRLRHVSNRRLPWRSPAAIRMMTVLWILAAAATLFISGAIEHPAAQVALGALAGGAAGNLLDGVQRNAVTDFVDLRVWPVFNIADAAIVTGAGVLAWALLR